MMPQFIEGWNHGLDESKGCFDDASIKVNIPPKTAGGFDFNGEV
jgi:hypothetical protein